jgi:hypothetical protein
MPRCVPRGFAALFFLNPNPGLVVMAPAVNGRGSTFETGAVTELFTVRTITGNGYPYDVSPDGQRFLINTLVGDSFDPKITVVTDWTAGLEN